MMTPKNEELIIKHVVNQLVLNDNVNANDIRAKATGTTVWLNKTIKSFPPELE